MDKKSEILAHIQKEIDKTEFSENHYLNYEDNDITKILKYYYYEKLAWCGCGSPSDAMLTVGKFLNALADNDLDGRKGKLKEAFGVESVYDNELLLCLAYCMDRAELTDHGSSIGWAWLTEDGEYFLWAIKEAEKDDNCFW